MEIKVCRSIEWSNIEWETYRFGFNEVFHKDFPTSYFKEKYLTVFKGYACHALLLSDDGDVVGGVTVIPCYYNSNEETFVNGLAVDVFIREAYRVDPLMLLRMYKKLKILLEKEEIVAVIAVPNAVAYPYWKNIIKLKDVGSISYWALPVNAGNILGKKGFFKILLNYGSQCYCFIVYFFSFICSLSGTKEIVYKYNICKFDPYFVEKFNNKSYIKYHDIGLSYIYKIEYENGVKTGYLLNAENGNVRTFKAFMEAVNEILKNHVDIVLYVGKIGFFQTLFLKVPRKFEPKLLPLICDLISKDEKYRDMLDYKNWDFGLKNYDVR